MENTQEQKTPETLKPEKMESGKWYWVKTKNNFLIKFNCIKGKMITKTKCFIVNKEREGFSNNLCHISNIKSIKAATKEEVLKYFPDEVFEPIELRPEEPIDWEAKYNELKAKYDQLEPKGEKVYFYHDGICWSYSKSLDDILFASREDYEIYEAVCIGKKKSVLVNETT